MEIKVNDIALLRQKIEEKVGRQMYTPKDFELLSTCILNELHENVSPSTLKRMWGYVPTSSMPRESTLDILAQFLGYGNWQAYCDKASTPSPTHEAPEAEKKP